MNILLWKQHKHVINKCGAFACKSEKTEEPHQDLQEIQITAVILSESHPSGCEVRWTPPKHVSLFVELLFNWFCPDALICSYVSKRKICFVFFTRGRAESPRRTGYFGCLPTPLRGCVSRPSMVRERRQKVWRGGLAWGELELKAQRLHLSLGPVPTWNTGALGNWPGVSGLPSSVTRWWHQNWNDLVSR